MAANMPIMFGKTIQRVPMAMLEPNRMQAATNHARTLEQIAERGGLAVLEVLHIVKGARWGSIRPSPGDEAELAQLVADFESK